MKSKLIIATLMLSSLAGAATINVGTGFGTNVGIVATLNNGTALTGGGYYVALGTFTSEPVITDGASLATAVGQFKMFAATTSPTAAGATQGKILGAFNGIDTAFNSAPFYFLVGDQPTQAASTEFGIFKMASGTSSFPANVALSGSTTVTVGNITQITTLAGTKIDAAPDQLKLMQVIPEPSAALLGALGALGLLRRRR